MMLLKLLQRMLEIYLKFKDCSFFQLVLYNIKNKIILGEPKIGVF